MKNDAFTAWLKGRHPNDGTWSTYRSDSRRVERHMGDLDDHYETDKLQSVINGTATAIWQGDNPDRPIRVAQDLFDISTGYKTAARKYQEFRGEFASVDLEEEDESATDLPSETPDRCMVFRFENHLQSALRANLGQLEPGLAAVDDGRERRVATGFIDITARDHDGTLVVIELKVGKASDRAISQIAGYMGALSEETGEKVRGLVVAEEFQDRARYASRAIPGLNLREYRYAFSFESVD